MARSSSLSFLLLLLPACRPRAEPVASSAGAWQPLPAADLGPVVGKVGDLPIYAAEVRAEMARGGRSAKEAFGTVVKLHLLAERGRRAGRALPASEAPPELLVQRFLERDFEPGITVDQMPEADLRRAYQQVQANYVHPRLVEVALLSVYTGPNMKPEPRARAREAAQALAEELAARPRRTAAELAALAEEKQWLDRKVAYWKFWQGPDRQHGPFGGKVAPAVQRLRRPGQQSGLIEDDSGYHFALYVDEKPAKNVSFETAREEIRAKAYPAWRRHKFDELVNRLTREHAVQIHADRVLAAPRPR